MPHLLLILTLLAFSMSLLSAKPKNWEPSIRAFEQHHAKTPPPEKPLLFVGSSSVRMWNLKDSFPGRATMNRGFGGSELSDSLQYFDRIVLPCRPRAILLYAGDNDIGNGETAEQVIADYKAFAAKVRSQLPKADFAYLPIKPSLARWNLWPEMQKANHAIKQLAAADPKLHYLDTVTPMLGEDGKPKKEFFLPDGLHMTPAGYQAWTAVVTPWLEALK